MWWGRILIVNILFHWCRLKISFPILLRLSHWFSKTHSAAAASSRTDPTLWWRQAWLCSDKDMLNSASHYLHFFSLASRKLKGMQINTSLCEGTVMSWNNEVWCVLFNCSAWLDCQDFTEQEGKAWIRRGETNRYWVRPSFAENMQGFHVMFCCLWFGSHSDPPWGLESSPLALCGLALPWCFVENDEQVPARWRGHTSLGGVEVKNGKHQRSSSTE